jgi:hypothetical protein
MNEEEKSLNEDKPWTDNDIYDLKASLRIGRSLKDIADFLLRRVDEVEAKMREIGLALFR